MSEMEILRQNFDNLQEGIQSYMNKMLNRRGADDNEFHTNSILGDIEKSNNKVLRIMNNVTTSNGN